jgi:hypothetical protein
MPGRPDPCSTLQVRPYVRVLSVRRLLDRRGPLDDGLWSTDDSATGVMRLGRLGAADEDEDLTSPSVRSTTSGYSLRGSRLVQLLRVVRCTQRKRRN